MNRGRARRALGGAVYLAVLFAVIGEVVVRLSGVASRHVPDDVYQPFDADIPYVPKPNLRQVRGWNDTLFDTDALGARARAGAPALAAKLPGEYRIVFVGDSVTFGEGVATAETFSALTEDGLRRTLAGVPVRTFNFGVSAYSVRQMAATIERRIAVVQPDLVVTTIVPADFDLSRIGTLDPWGAVRPSGSESRVPWLTHTLRRMHLIHFLLDVARGWRPTWESTPVVGVPESFAYVASMRAVCERQHFDCGLVLVSTKVDGGFGPLMAPLRAAGMPVLDLTALADDFTVEQFNAGPHDPHPSAAVHRRIAERLTAWIAARRASRL